MIDTSKARSLLNELENRSNPTSATGSDLCTVADLKRVIQATTKTLDALIRAIENDL